MTNRPKIEWTDSAFELNSYRFIQEWGAKIGDLNPEFPAFALMKTRGNVQAYVDFLDGRRCDRILELGIMKGGSCVFFNELLKPSLHVAVELEKALPRSLSAYVEVVARDKRRLLPVMGVSQADIGAIKAVIGEEPLDFVVDDASHDYALSRASFEGLFPLLRPGGVYALEDWGWAQWGGEWDKPDHAWASLPALSNLVLEICLICTSYSHIVSSVHVTPVTTFIIRGQAAIDQLVVTEAYRARGRKLAYI